MHVTFKDCLYRNPDGQILVPMNDKLAVRKLRISLHNGPPFCWSPRKGNFPCNFYWPKMASDVADFVASCDQCQRNKAANGKPSGVLHLLQVPDGLWESVFMDPITHLPETPSGNTAIAVLVDTLPKMVRLAALALMPSNMQASL